MPNKRIDQLATASEAEVQDASLFPLDVNGAMKAATLAQIKSKTLDGLKTINGQSLKGTGNININGSTMSAGGENTTVFFTTPKYYGTIDNPVAGNISYNLAGATPGTNVVIFHEDSAEPTFPAGTYRLNNAQYVYDSPHRNG